MSHTQSILVLVLFASSILVGGLWFTVLREAPDSQSHVNRAVVIELYTSQGCSSCPPAEELVRELSTDKRYRDRIIPLVFHVDYWDYLGWKDPYSSSAWSERQADYMEALGGKTLYTPQLVVHGREEMVGSDRNRVIRTINQLEKKLPAHSIEVGLTNAYYDEQAIHLAIEPLARPTMLREYVLQAVVFEHIPTTDVKRGENKGRTLRNDFVVRALIRNDVSSLPRESLHQLAIPLEEDWQPDRMGVVLLVQHPKTMHIAGVSTVKNVSLYSR